MSETLVLPTGFGLAANADLALLAFGADRPGASAATIGPRHLAFLPPEALELDLADPAQRDFGVYELLEKIGQGGMGVVYRARQKALDREVALKLLAAGPWASTGFISRFRQEAQSAARMEHPNIVTVFETGSHEDLHYFSMRLVRGQSLATRLRESGPCTPVAAARLMRTVAEAVDYAHRLGVLHLDLKPGNILMDEHGEPLVADFGLARRLDQVLAEQSDEVSGTPSYMAPEQAQARSLRIGAATDIYGLGAILYELLTGAPPFLAATPQETLQRVVDDEVQPLRERRKGIPADLEAICLKCLAKDPDARYPKARQLAEDLGRFLEGRTVSVRPLNFFQRTARWARREPRFAAAVTVSALALIIGLLATLQEWRRAEGNAQTSRELLWGSRRETALRLEQDGKGHEALPQLLANIVDEEHAGKSADVALERRRVGMLLAQGATLIDRIVVADANPLAAEISPDGSLLAVSFNDQSVRWYDTATLTQRGRVSLGDRTASDGQRRPIFLLRFVDDHRLRATLEWISNVVSPDDDETWLIDLDHAKLIAPPAVFADFAEATYSADGRTALLRNHKSQIQLWQAPQSQAQWRPLSALVAKPVSVATDQPWLLDSKGRFAAYLTTAMRGLVFYDLPGLTTAHPIDLPHNAGISSWALSSDGNVLALGDFEGRIFLLDTTNRTVRTLPTTRGREITWISFSEDDAWFATASFDGVVHAFDVASGESLVAGQMDHDFAVQRVGLSHAQRLLVAASDGKMALWHLPLRGPRAVPAQRIGFAPAPHGLAGRYPIGFSLNAGLLASTGMDGQVRLWRLPTPPLLPARAARQVPEQTWFDGRHLVDVEWDRLRIVATNGAALTPWIKLPQPPGFAELLDNGQLLVTTIGPQLRIFDAKTLQPRFPPIALDASPQRLLANADGSRVLLSFGGSSPDGFQERLQLYNARTGQRLPGEAVVRGQLRHLAFSADNARILAVGPAEGSTSAIATTGLRIIGNYPNDPDQPVKWADFAADGNIVMVTSPTDARLDSDTLLTWDAANDRVLAKRSIGQVNAIGVIANNAGAFVAGVNRDLQVSRAGNAETVERLAHSEPLAVMAPNANHRIIAHAFRHEVQLYDADTFAAIGPPLRADSDAIDSIDQLAFSPGDDELLARTQEGRWLLWPIATEQRPAAELQTQLARLRVDNENQQTEFMPTPDERKALRSRDLGPWLAPEIRTAPAQVALSTTGQPIPARTQGASPWLLDLSQHYDFSPEEVRNTFYSVRPFMRPFPVGVQRIAGVDYELHGMTQVGDPNQSRRYANANGDIRCVPVPPGAIAAIHPLLSISTASPLQTDTPIGDITLHYVDGGSAVLPLRAGRELPGFNGNDQGVPQVFASDIALVLFGYDDKADLLSSPRMVNPDPQRAVRCLDISGRDNPGAIMLLFAVTAEPAAPVPPAAEAVIPGVDTRNTRAQAESTSPASPPDLARGSQ